MAAAKPILAIVSPFIDKRHGTERRVAEWTQRLTDDFDVHVYSQRVEDLDLTKFTWHRIPKLPGPHLTNFIWWLAANHLWRWWDRRFRGIRHDLVFTAGNHRTDRVYVTTVFRDAQRFASPNKKPVVYEVEPEGTLEDDPDAEQSGHSYACEKAKIIAIHKVPGKVIKKARQAALNRRQ